MFPGESILPARTKTSRPTQLKVQKQEAKILLVDHLG